MPLAELLNAELGHILPGIQGVVYGVAIIVIILLAPEGIYWRIRDRLAAERESRAGTGRGGGAPRYSVPLGAEAAAPVVAADVVRLGQANRCWFCRACHAHSAASRRLMMSA